ncbi:lipopolysaccharide biosynthesis protein [Meridianimarinicoccus aquatilis]|uniref:lipopolysaccharide biosynthesis protein n=1 Tax=Meridianimarinicoccus aquatilis TaxID=2552766 RepID=UPI001404DE15|nr:lipopolysaccharide biosynthesis protein [Fluviibacterium aquatile]
MPEAAADPRDAIFDTTEMEQQLGRRAGRASIFVLAISILKIAQQIGSIAIIARLIPPEDYGIFAMALPGVMIALALSNFGLPQAIVQRRTINHMHVSALFWLNLAFASVMMVVLAALAWPAAAYYGEPRVVPVFQVISLSLLFSAMSSQYLSILRRTLRIRAAELSTLVAELLGLAVAVIAALWGLSYWALVLQQLVTPILKTVFMAVQCRWWPSAPHNVRFRDAMGSVSFGGFVAGFAILHRLTEYSGTVVAGSFFTPAAAGLFYRARNLAGIPPLRLIIPLSGVFVPTLSRLQDTPEEFRRMFVRLISRANLALLPIAVFVAAASDPLVALLMGPDWSEAAPLLFWMSLFTLREGGTSGLQFAFIACGKSRALFGFAALRLVLVAGALAAGAQHGLLAMAVAYTLCELLITLPLMVAVAHRVTPISPRVFLAGSGLDMILAAALAAVLAWGVAPLVTGLPVLAQLVVLGAAVAGVYGVRVAISKDLRGDVRRVLESVLRRAKA